MSAVMLTKTAVAHFGTKAELARALIGSRTQSAVYLWEEVIPLAAARRLEKITEGKLAVDSSLYDEFGHIIRKSEAAA